jgi:hypothetical protein
MMALNYTTAVSRYCTITPLRILDVLLSRLRDAATL